MRTLSLVLCLMCTFTLNISTVEAKSADAFFKRFQVIRTQDGKLIGIRDRTLPVKFSVAPYISHVKSELLNEQSFMSRENLASGKYDAEVRSVLSEGMDFNLSGNQEEFDKDVEVVLGSLKKLAALNVEGIFSNDIFSDVVNQYQGKMTDAILMLDPSMVANVADSTFFYKRNVTYKAVSWGLDFARKRLSSIPMLNTASYVIVQVENLITQRREFHQNMLLHYLENFKEEELGLTHDEVNMIWSSIYESRIPWFAFWESNNAKNNWLKYGVNNFYTNFRMGSTNLKNAQNLYSEVSDRMNYGFQKVTYNNEKVIINLFDRENMFQSRPAVAYNYDRPTQIVRKRVVLELAGLGLSFVPLNSTIKDSIDRFIKSYYEQQKITEGALYGYFESNQDAAGRKQVLSQYMNPFDTLL